MSKQEIEDEICYAHDGPLTSFVVVCRAMECVRRGADAGDAANVLAETLEAIHGIHID